MSALIVSWQILHLVETLIAGEYNQQANRSEPVITNLIYPEPEAAGLALTTSGEDLLLRRLALYRLEYTEYAPGAIVQEVAH